MIKEYDGTHYSLKKCSICGTDRFNEDKEPKWKSNLIIEGYAFKDLRITVCPKCRELPLKEIFRRLIGKLSKCEIING